MPDEPGRTPSPVDLLAEWFHDGNEDGCDCIKGLPGPLLCQEWAENMLDALAAGGYSVVTTPARTTTNPGYQAAETAVPRTQNAPSAGSS